MKIKTMAVFTDEKPDIVWRGGVKMFSAEMNAIVFVFEKKFFIISKQGISWCLIWHIVY